MRPVIVGGLARNLPSHGVQDVTKVVLGAASMLSNGAALSRVGTVRVPVVSSCGRCFSSLTRGDCRAWFPQLRHRSTSRCCFAAKRTR